jgi:hypothetical protein
MRVKASLLAVTMTSQPITQICRCSQTRHRVEWISFMAIR